tara:strand:+ start:3499 stop:3846 length:348 start_codon:yes stop_codon:yes gene_type:complete
LQKDAGIWKRRQYFTEDTFSEYLIEQKITDVKLAGECGPWEGSTFGCVGKLYDAIKDKIKVKGVPGAIFPLEPYDRHLKLGQDPEFTSLANLLPEDPFQAHLELLQCLYPTHQFS